MGDSGPNWQVRSGRNWQIFIGAKIMKRLSNLLYLAFAGCIALPAVVRGETFSIDLHPTSATGTFGQFLSAPFDFGTAFSQIQSLKVEFVMPDGYEGGGYTTGNSTVFRLLKVAVHGSPVPSIPPASAVDLSGTTLTDSFFRVPTGTAIAEPIGVLTISDGIGGPVASVAGWPDFVQSGHGWVSFIDEITGVPEGITLESSTSWNAPTVASARLIISATPVPEPSTIALVCLGLAVIGLRRFAV
jgi:hypothetical protein